MKKLYKRGNKIPKIIALLFLLSMTTSMLMLPTSTAHSPPWGIPTFAYISVTPNPVGVGQDLNVVVWVDKSLPGALAANDIRLKDYK